MSAPTSVPASTASGASALAASTLGEDSPDPATGAPAAFTKRTSLPSCGVAERPGLNPAPPDAASVQAVTCFTTAVGSAAGAELEVRGTTVEGDVIPVHLRALPGTTTVERFSDNTGDKYGTRIWTSATCTGFDSERVDGANCGKETEYLVRPIEGRWIPREINVVAGYELPTSPEARAKLAVEFRGGSMKGSDGCNRIFAEYDVDAVGRFRSGESGSTFVYCDGPPTLQVVDEATSVVITRDRLRFMKGERILADFVPDDCLDRRLPDAAPCYG